MARTTAATGAGPLGRNHQRKPGLGLVRPLLLPVAHPLKPLMGSYTMANATAAGCGVRWHAMVGTRRGRPDDKGHFSYESVLETRPVY